MKAGPCFSLATLPHVFTHPLEPGVLRSMGLQRVRCDLATEQQCRAMQSAQAPESEKRSKRPSKGERQGGGRGGHLPHTPQVLLPHGRDLEMSKSS